MRPRLKVLYLAANARGASRGFVIDTRCKTKTDSLLDPLQALTMAKDTEYALFIVESAVHEVLSVIRLAKDLRPELPVLLIAADQKAEEDFSDSLATKTVVKPSAEALLADVKLMLKRKRGPKGMVLPADPFQVHEGVCA